MTESQPSPRAREKKPSWLKVRAPGGENYTRLKRTLRGLDLYTECEEAHCPNVGECWSSGTMTVMLLGHTCTRGCRFCAVTTGNPRGAVDPREPDHAARAIAGLGLKYVVLTMVDRDDLLDGGALQVARTVTALKREAPSLLVEVLVSDFQGRMRDVDLVLGAEPEVFAHNLEVTRRLTRLIRDQRSSYDQSLAVLSHARSTMSRGLVKSSLMVGIGESDDEVFETLAELRAAGVDVVTVGQYLQPSPKHADVKRYVQPELFAEYERRAYDLGFAYVASGPLVRSSYHAAEAFMAAKLRSQGPESKNPAQQLPDASGAGLGPGPQNKTWERLGPQTKTCERLGPQNTNLNDAPLLHPSSLLRRRP
jgi:lipoic acid synthetase